MSLRLFHTVMTNELGSYRQNRQNFCPYRAGCILCAKCLHFNWRDCTSIYPTAQLVKVSWRGFPERTAAIRRNRRCGLKKMVSAKQSYEAELVTPPSRPAARQSSSARTTQSTFVRNCRAANSTLRSATRNGAWLRVNYQQGAALATNAKTSEVPHENLASPAHCTDSRIASLRDLWRNSNGQSQKDFGHD